MLKKEKEDAEAELKGADTGDGDEEEDAVEGAGMSAHHAPQFIGT